MPLEIIIHCSQATGVGLYGKTHSFSTKVSFSCAQFAVNHIISLVVNFSSPLANRGDQRQYPKGTEALLTRKVCGEGILNSSTLQTFKIGRASFSFPFLIFNIRPVGHQVISLWFFFSVGYYFLFFHELSS